MPGVSTFVVGRRRQPAVREPTAPVRLSLELMAVAGGAILPVDLRAARDLRPVARIGAAFVARLATGEQRQERRGKAKGRPP